MAKGKVFKPSPAFFMLFYLIPSILPILFLLPCFVVGIPVAFAILRFTEVTPNALFQLNDRPGIAFLRAIVIFLSLFNFQHKFVSYESYANFPVIITIEFRSFLNFIANIFSICISP